MAGLQNGKEESSEAKIVEEGRASSPSLTMETGKVPPVDRASSKKASMPWVQKLLMNRTPSSGANKQQYVLLERRKERMDGEKNITLTMAIESVKEAGLQQNGKEEHKAAVSPTVVMEPMSKDDDEMPGEVGCVPLPFSKGDANQRQAKGDANQRQAMSAQGGKDEPEASSSIWMQMAQEVTDLESASAMLEPVCPGPPEEEELPLLSGPSSAAAGSTSSWTGKMERILQGNTLTRRVEGEMWKKPSIYRVPEWIKSNNRRAYRPEVVSLGPFHHGQPNLLPMEEHKRRLMLHMVKRSGKPLQEFVDAVEEVADKLRDAYDGIDKKWLGQNNSTGRFVEMMLTDGGFLLELMTITAEGGMRDYDVGHDPIFSIHGILDLKRRIRSDMCLVENQLPLLLLFKLEEVRSRKPPIAINNLVARFLNGKPVKCNGNLGLHPLDVFHKSFCCIWLEDSSRKERSQQEERNENTMRSAVELSEAGINFKKSETQSIQDIDFKDGVLSMPPVEVDHTTEKTFLNLMAFEKVHRSAGTHATDYMIFMDNIIDSERDLALLRKKGVISNFLSSDKAAARLFNTLRKGAKLNPSSKLGHVQWKVAAHCKKPWNKWRAIFVQTYLSNPWVFISLVAASILLSLTILQTAYAIVPFYTKGK
ncbi:hypothetical protein EJB05_40716, partial [Eragrostis curvula]